MKRLIIILAILAFGLSLSASAQINQYYVSINGSDSNNGQTPSTPWRSCSKAFTSPGGFVLGSGGAVLNFSPGDYGSCTVTRGGSSLTTRLQMKCLQQWTVGGNNCKLGFMITSASNVDIGAPNNFGFEYTDPNASSAVDVNWQCGSSPTCASGNSIHVFGNYFHDVAQNVSGGCPLAGMILIPNVHGATSPDAQVVGNVVDHFGKFPNPCGNGAQGIYIATAGGQVYNNISVRNAYSGLQYYDQACNARISNNVFANNTVGMVLYGSNGCSPVGLNTVSNNVIVNNTQQAFNNSFAGDQGCSSGKQTLYTNNLVFGNGTNGFTATPASCTVTQNQKSENPLTTFVNYTGDASGDYHTKAGSQANGGGTKSCALNATSPCSPTVDIAGLARSATAPTIGVFEFGGSVQIPPGPPTGLSVVVH